MLRINKYLCMAGCMLFLALQGKGQIRMSYQLGSIGMTGDVKAKMSSPFLLGYMGCFSITNGLQKFSPVKLGLFNIACIEKAPENRLQLQTYPNPVINQLQVKSLIRFPETLQAVYQLMIVDFTGKVIRSLRSDIQSINAGLSIPMEDLPHGFYTLSVYANKELVQSFKIIKS
ncbi:MAG: T9SS type A sorting domain-containing protein [Bacteroidota bacterium]|nr:T9SS type A sorting domain-containing protein [Bacteroidota bacterium]